MDTKPKNNLTVFLLIIAFLASFGFGFLAGYFQENHRVSSPEEVDFSLFWEVWHALEESFVDPEMIDYEKMIYGAISGMLESLEDPYTVFMEPEDLKVFREDVGGEFQGVGMEIGIREGELTVIAPLEGTPADRAGLRAGDKIIKIDGEDTQDMLTDKAVKLIRGPKNTEVILTVFREGWTEPRDFNITRDVIEIPSLRWELLEDNIAYIKLYYFPEVARSTFDAAVFEILNSPAESIILDLRNNTGGYLNIAHHIAGWFLEKGDIVTIEESGPEGKKIFYESEGPSQLSSYPTVVLVNQGSASASEILAGALRDNLGAKLVGKTTFGKGSIQELKELSVGGLKVTIARWLTPDGHLITNKGLEPDFEISLTEDDIIEDRDPQLEKAVELLKNL